MPKVLDGALDCQQKGRSLNNVIGESVDDDLVGGDRGGGGRGGGGPYVGLSLPADASIDERYNEYVKRIFNWSTYRNLTNNGDVQFIERKNMTGLVEMEKLANYFGNP